MSDPTSEYLVRQEATRLEARNMLQTFYQTFMVERKLSMGPNPNRDAYDDTDADGNPVPVCLYRSPEGHRCAAGLFIKDEFYSPELEGHSVSHNTVHDALVQSGMGEHLGLIQKLQRVHDYLAMDLKDKRLTPEMLALHLRHAYLSLNEAAHPYNLHFDPPPAG